MNIIPIQVTDEGVLIPRTYLPEAIDVELMTTSEYILVRAKKPVRPGNGEQKATIGSGQTRGRRYTFLGSGHSRNPKASVEAESILEEEVDRLHGWSLES